MAIPVLDLGALHQAYRQAVTEAACAWDAYQAHKAVCGCRLRPCPDVDRLIASWRECERQATVALERWMAEMDIQTEGVA